MQASVRHSVFGGGCSSICYPNCDYMHSNSCRELRRFHVFAGRTGQGGRAIRVLKLRRMVADAGDVEKRLGSDQLKQRETERKVDNDPRVIRMGKFNCKTSIDELPQFLSVLKGDVSVIGPRRIAKDELAWFGEDAAEYLSVPMGITDL